MGLELLACLLAFSQPTLQAQGGLQHCIVSQYQQEEREHRVLNHLLQYRNLSEKDKEFYTNINTIMNNALYKEDGWRDICKHHEKARIGNDDVDFNIKFQYACGPRGGSGKLRVLFYLDEANWYSSKGIDNIRIFFFSKEKTKMSKKMYEINTNSFDKVVDHMSLEERMIETSYLFHKSEKALYKLLKKIKIDKKDIKEILFVKDIVKELLDYRIKQKAIQAGNLIAGDHVWLTEFEYFGYGFFDMDEQLRATKLVELEITRGEESIVGFQTLAFIRDYEDVYNGHVVKGTERYRTPIITRVAPLNIERVARSVGAIPESEEEVEEEKED